MAQKIMKLEERKTSKSSKRRIKFFKWRTNLWCFYQDLSLEQQDLED